MTKNTFGQSVTVSLFGESHGAAVGAVLSGMAPGIELDEEYLRARMRQRQASGGLSTPRHEPDRVEILSGVFEGRTTGTPICLMIENTNTKSGDYSRLRQLMRPGHADYTAWCKYHGCQDYRGGGHFSGRITAGLVAAGAIARMALKNRGIRLASHISRCAGIEDRPIDPLCPAQEDMQYLEEAMFPVLCEDASQKMQQAIMDARARGDSLGGILETVVTGIPAGVGEPWFDSVESVLSHGLFSIPAVKGLSFGAGFGFAEMPGSRANDPFTVKDGEVRTCSNNNGGINGGITNGMPLVFSCVIKPTPSISMPQSTVDISTMSDSPLQVQGRHDPAIIHRARAVVEAVCALTLCDLLAQRYGTDYLAGKQEA